MQEPANLFTALYELFKADQRVLIEEAVRRALPQTHHAPEVTPLEEILTVKQVSELLNVSICTVHCRKRRGILKYYKNGASTYFFRSEVLASIRAQPVVDGRRPTPRRGASSVPVTEVAESARPIGRR